MIDKLHTLRHKTASEEKVYHLFENKTDIAGKTETDVVIGVQTDEGTRFVPSIIGGVSGSLSFHNGSDVNHLIDVTPKIIIHCYWESHPTPYGTTYTCHITGADLTCITRSGFRIYIGNGSSWVGCGTLPSGSTSVSLSGAFSTDGSSTVYVKVTSDVSYTSLNGHVDWAYAGEGTYVNIHSYVYLDSPLPKGYIDSQGIWTGILPPWRTEGRYGTVGAGASAGNVNMGFAGLAAGSTYYETALIYNPQSSGSGEQRVAVRGWAPTGGGAFFTDYFTLQIPDNAEQDIITEAISDGLILDIPEVYW